VNQTLNVMAYLAIIGLAISTLMYLLDTSAPGRLLGVWAFILLGLVIIAGDQLLTWVN